LHGRLHRTVASNAPSGLDPDDGARGSGVTDRYSSDGFALLRLEISALTR
jgi:hypothetical protein